MSNKPLSKIQLSARALGIIIGAVGILHGVSELMQGSALVETNSVVALPENWPNEIFYVATQGQPAFSILTGIPFYILGILSVLVSTVLIIHSWFFQRRKYGLLIFVVLNVLVLFFGGGVGTPTMVGLPVVIFWIIANRTSKKKERSASANKLNLTLFRVCYWMHIFSWLLFCPGFVIMSAYGKIPEPLFLFDFMSMPISLLGALIFGLRYDNTFPPVKN